MEVEIKNVPHSPHTGVQPTPIFNPLDEDFKVDCNAASGGKPITLPAGKTIQLPEFQAYHAAKHLAKYIVKKSFYTEAMIKELEVRKVGGFSWGTVMPSKRVEAMQDYLLNPTGACPEKLENQGASSPVGKPLEEMTWNELRKLLKEKGKFDRNLNRQQAIEVLSKL